MSKKRKILDLLTKAYLVDLARDHEVKYAANLNKDQLLDRLAGMRSVKVEDVLGDMSLADLKVICSGLGLDDTGRGKDLLIYRMLSRDKPSRSKISQTPKRGKEPVKVNWDTKQKQTAKPERDDREARETKAVNKETMAKMKAENKKNNGNSSFEQIFKNIDDVLWKEAGCSSELDYTEQTSWMLFLKYLDDLEMERAIDAELRDKRHNFIIDEKHRWSSWAAPRDPMVVLITMLP